MTLDFTTFLPFETYKEVAEHVLKYKDTKDYKLMWEKKDILTEALFNYLQARANEGLLKMPEGSDTHRSNFLTAWKHLLENKLESYEKETITYAFNYIIMVAQTRAENATPEDSYQSFTKIINNGNFNHHAIQGTGECFECGQKMNIQSKGWNFELINVDYKSVKEQVITPLKPCMEDKVIEVEVDFPTGQVYAADWFRIPDFTSEVEYNKNYDSLGINSSLGRIKAAEHYAALGFVSINVGNSSPHIFKEGDNFFFGREVEDKPNKYKELGYVCTDLWNVTLIDKSKLIEIVAIAQGVEKAEETVNKYLEANKHNYTEISMTPGKYQVAFHAKNYLNAYDTEIDEGVKTYISVKKVIEPAKKLKI